MLRTVFRDAGPFLLSGGFIEFDATDRRAPFCYGHVFGRQIPSYCQEGFIEHRVRCDQPESAILLRTVFGETGAVSRTFHRACLTAARNVSSSVVLEATGYLSQCVTDNVSVDRSHLLTW